MFTLARPFHADGWHPVEGESVFRSGGGHGSGNGLGNGFWGHITSVVATRPASDSNRAAYTRYMSQMRVEPENPSWTTTKVVAVIVAILTAGYMLPWAIAAVRDVPHWGVFWINLLLGWTIIGWIVALVMALRSQRQVIVG